MGEQDNLLHLTKIQEIDIQISEVLTQREQFPKKIKELKETLRKKKEVIDTLNNSIATNEKERKRLQGEIDLENERIERIENKLPQIKTNKEYQALCKELDTMKKEIKKHEDSILELLAIDEKLKAEESGSKEVFESEQNDITTQIASYESEISKFQGVIDKLESAKKEFTKHVDAKILASYERIKNKRDGMAVVAAIKGVCQGCFMNVPPQLFIMIQKNLELNYCPNCSRMLYWKEG